MCVPCLSQTQTVDHRRSFCGNREQNEKTTIGIRTTIRKHKIHAQKQKTLVITIVCALIDFPNMRSSRPARREKKEALKPPQRYSSITFLALCLAVALILLRIDVESSEQTFAGEMHKCSSFNFTRKKDTGLYGVPVQLAFFYIAFENHSPPGLHET